LIPLPYGPGRDGQINYSLRNIEDKGPNPIKDLRVYELRITTQIFRVFFTTGVPGPGLGIVTIGKSEVTPTQVSCAECSLSPHAFSILKTKLGLEGEGFFQAMLYPEDKY